LKTLQKSKQQDCEINLSDTVRSVAWGAFTHKGDCMKKNKYKVIFGNGGSVIVWASCVHHAEILACYPRIMAGLNSLVENIIEIQG